MGDDKLPLADGRWDSLRVWVRIMKYKLLNAESGWGFSVCVAKASGSAEKAEQIPGFGSNALGEGFTKFQGPQKGKLSQKSQIQHPGASLSLMVS